MFLRRVTVGMGALLGLIILVLLGQMGYDEFQLRAIHPGESIADVHNRLGTPSLDMTPVPSDSLFRESRECGPGRPTRLLVYHRKLPQKALLIYLTSKDRVQCVVRRRYTILAR